MNGCCLFQEGCLPDLCVCYKTSPRMDLWPSTVCLLTEQQQFDVPLGFQPVHLQGVIDQPGPGRRRPLLRRHGTSHFHIKKILQLNTIFKTRHYMWVNGVVCVIGNRCDTHTYTQRLFCWLCVCDMMWSSWCNASKVGGRRKINFPRLLWRVLLEDMRWIGEGSYQV